MQPLGLVHIGTAGPSLGGSRYVVMFVDSASRLQRPYGVHEKSAAAIFLSSNASWQIWGSHAHSALTTAPSTRTVCSWTSAMASEFVASLRHRTRQSRIDRYRELSRLDTRRNLEFQSCTRTSAWTRSGAVPTRQERASGWSRYSVSLAKPTTSWPYCQLQF